MSWIIPENGILDLLATARVVVSHNDNAHFVIVGHGPFRGEYTNKVIELGLREHVTWTGVLEDVVCQVSRWEEVFGWVIAEGMAYRKHSAGHGSIRPRDQRNRS